MIKTAMIAIWACAVMFGASLEVGGFLKSRAQSIPVADPAAFETRKTKEINIPIIRDGGVRGFVVLQLSYVVDLLEAKKLPVQPDSYVVDEAFRYIFDDDRIDFTHLDKIELDKMLRGLMFRVNTRTKSQVITDMGVLECNFLLNAEAKDPKVENKLKPEVAAQP
jgi:hypothetical protein